MGNTTSNTCTIQFDQNSYIPGDAVTGTLNVQIDNDVEIDQVELTLVGKEHITWPADIGETKITNAIKHHHKLAPSTKIGLWICDGCERHSNKCPDMVRYCCSEDCDFDLCNACSHFHEVTLMLDGEKPALDQTTEWISPADQDIVGGQPQLQGCRPKPLAERSLRKGDCEFLRRNIPLNTLCGLIEAGSSNKYPFSFALPGDLAGSKSLVNSNFGLQRSYELCTSVKVHGYWSQNFACSRSIHVVDQPQVFGLSGAQVLASPEFHNFIGMSLGRFVISAKQELPLYGRRGDELCIHLELENFTDKDADRLELKLYQRLRLKSNDFLDYKHECIVQEWAHAGLRRNSMERGDDARKLFLPLSQDIAPQSIGSLVECSYYLKIQACLTKHQAEARIPVCVLPFLNSVQPALPPPSAPPAIQLLITDERVQAYQAVALAPAFH